jgi:hypothetical protein
VTSRRKHFQDRVSIATICRDQNADGRPSLTKPTKAFRLFHARQIVVNNSQGRAGLILAKYSRQFPEIPAGKDFRKIQAAFHDVEKPCPAQRMLVSYDCDLIVASHAAAPLMTSVASIRRTQRAAYREAI